MRVLGLHHSVCRVLGFDVLFFGISVREVSTFLDIFLSDDDDAV